MALIRRKGDMKLTLTTMPISTNKLYQGRRFLTKEGKANKEAISWEAKAQWMPRKPITGKIAITGRLYFKDGRMLDIENLKALWDSLSGIVYEDDRQIHELHLFKGISKEHPRVELTIASLKV